MRMGTHQESTDEDAQQQQDADQDQQSDGPVRNLRLLHRGRHFHAT